jgi:hypothetical protein
MINFDPVHLFRMEFPLFPYLLSVCILSCFIPYVKTTYCIWSDSDSILYRFVMLYAGNEKEWEILNCQKHMTHSFLLHQLGVICVWHLTFEMLRWYSILSFEFQCNVTTFSYLETNEIVSIVNFFIFWRMLNNPAVTMDGVCKHLFIF